MGRAWPSLTGVLQRPCRGQVDGSEPLFIRVEGAEAQEGAALPKATRQEATQHTPACSGRVWPTVACSHGLVPAAQGPRRLPYPAGMRCVAHGVRGPDLVRLQLGARWYSFMVDSSRKA